MKKKEIKRGDVYICNLPKEEGSVQSGERPCVIVSNNSNNKYADIVIVVPITSKEKNNIPTHVPILVEEESTILCETPRTISKKLIYNKIGHIKQMKKINDALKVAFGLVIY